jgi:Sugar phosphate isomerases/epimerases
VKAIGSHAYYPDMEVMKARLEYQKEVGVPTIGAAASFFTDEDDVKRQCETFNKLGEMSKQLGIRFYYHNHFHEFQKMNGKTVYDIMLENTDPDLVFFELDTYWAVRAGMDPVSVMDKLGKRLIMLHQKDLPADYNLAINLFDGIIDGNESITMNTFMGLFMANPAHGQAFAEVGTGTLPIQSYIDKANELNVEYIVLEQDFTKRGELESITYSMEAFKKYKGVE